MSDQENNRVLSRRGARIINEQETRKVNGGLNTETFCSFEPGYGADGDQFTNDCIAN